MSGPHSSSEARKLSFVGLRAIGISRPGDARGASPPLAPRPAAWQLRSQATPVARGATRTRYFVQSAGQHYPSEQHYL